MVKRERYILVAVAAVAVLLGLLLLLPWASSTPGVEPTEPKPASTQRTSPEQIAAPPSGEEAAVPRAVAKKKVSKQERERYRRAIRDALSKRPGPDSKRPPPTREVDREETQRAPSGELKDRSGGTLSGLMEDLQKDVMPLADECYELAREHDPTLAGGLDLQFEIIGDEDVGGLVESVDLVESSDIQDAELIECMRETLLSTVFPAPDDSGATGVQLSLRFSPDE